MVTSKENTDTADSVNVAVPVEKKRTIILGGKEYPMDDEGCVDFTGIRIPNIPISSLPGEIIYRAGDKFFTITFAPDEKQNVNFFGYGELNADPSILSYRALSRLYRYSIKVAKKRIPSIRDISDQEADYFLNVGFSAHIKATTLRELFKMAEEIAAEVTAPVIEVQNLVFTFIQELKRKSKK
jgi:hypothetical protein